LTVRLNELEAWHIYNNNIYIFFLSKKTFIKVKNKTFNNALEKITNVYKKQTKKPKREEEKLNSNTIQN